MIMNCTTQQRNITIFDAAIRKERTFNVRSGKTEGRYVLTLVLATPRVMRDIIIAPTLTDLVYELCQHWGLGSIDAQKIVNHAAGGN